MNILSSKQEMISMLIDLQAITSNEEKTKFEQLYLRYKGLMYMRAFDILQNVQDAEDAVHQAFVKIAEIISVVDEADNSRTKAFVVTIVENMAIDMYRARVRRGEVPLDEAKLDVQVAYAGTDDLVACICRLPMRERQILLLRHYYGLDLKEIAVMFGLSKANARKIAWRAREKLEAMCKEDGIL